MYMKSLIYKNQAIALYVMWGILSPRAKGNYKVSSRCYKCFNLGLKIETLMLHDIYTIIKNFQNTVKH